MPSCCSPASSAKLVGHPDADRLLADVTEVLATRFWEAQHGAVGGGVRAATGRRISRYRGQNSNMHLTEATMAAFEATGDAPVPRHGGNHRHAHHRPAARAATAGGSPSISTRTGSSTANYPTATSSVPTAPPPATRSNGRASSSSSGSSAAAGSPGCPRRRRRSSRAPSAQAGTPSRAASSTRSTGTASRTSATGSGGRRRRASAPPPS